MVQHLDHVEEALAINPVITVRVSRAGGNSREFLSAVNFYLADESSPYHFVAEASHIRRRANANRKRNRAARAARRHNRQAA